jgi:hypothetical protein
MEEPPPIVFSMNVHCRQCGDTIRRSIVRTFGTYARAPTVLWCGIYILFCTKLPNLIRISHACMDLHAGASRVFASPRLAMVVVHGGAHLDPWTLKYFLQRLGEARSSRHGGGASMRGRGVTVVSDGGRPQRSHYEGIVHMAPTPPYPYPYPYHPSPPPPPPQPFYGRRWF